MYIQHTLFTLVFTVKDLKFREANFFTNESLWKLISRNMWKLQKITFAVLSQKLREITGFITKS